MWLVKRIDFAPEGRAYQADPTHPAVMARRASKDWESGWTHDLSETFVYSDRARADAAATRAERVSNCKCIVVDAAAARLGSRGGSAASRAKSRAARANGAKGGRPKKTS